MALNYLSVPLYLLVAFFIPARCQCKPCLRFNQLFDGWYSPGKHNDMPLKQIRRQGCEGLPLSCGGVLFRFTFKRVIGKKAITIGSGGQQVQQPYAVVIGKLLR
jgi:hypothetical protein